ncbi:MAG: hypothetical protein ACTSVI_09660 [Promethearchaeota archaeon]
MMGIANDALHCFLLGKCYENNTPRLPRACKSTMLQLEKARVKLMANV